jgi:hypothetical protein
MENIEMNSEEAFEEWWVENPEFLYSEMSDGCEWLAAKAWQAALEWAAKGQEPVAWLVKTSPDGYPFTENPRYAERHNGQPLYLHPAPIPEGWKLVPINATAEQHASVRGVLRHHNLTVYGDGVIEADLIHAVLDAAPEYEEEK